MFYSLFCSALENNIFFFFYSLGEQEYTGAGIYYLRKIVIEETTVYERYRQSVCHKSKTEKCHLYS